MKVIITDNYDTGRVSDRLFRAGLTSEEAEKVAAEENAKCYEGDSRFFQAVPDDHVLFVFEP